MNTALLLVDIQNDYFKGGRNELFNTDTALAHAQEALSLFREKSLPIVHIQCILQEENAAFFLPGTEGIKIHEGVKPQSNEKVIVKHTPDSFFQTELQKHLESVNVTRLVICGMMSHICIDSTVRTAHRLGYEVILLGEACTTKDLVWNDAVIPAKTVHDTFMASLQDTFAQVMDTSSLYDMM
ncbi:cysteine hydrolase family protein [Brevibacillus nitrificans]|uniref:cysteine hydrolase family protein n=1 Tax=Brevibacillus nitrificans TaxID=651560 RepID=UPI002634AEE0|nr:cysteine hydrolase family protein [Brevibacillus nitrificans]MED1793577.1 cysteine hydrolase family protein [Brevibacillus nitrificans]